MEIDKYASATSHVILMSISPTFSLTILVLSIVSIYVVTRGINLSSRANSL